MRLRQALVPALTREVLSALNANGIYSVEALLRYGDAKIAEDAKLAVSTVVLLREQLLSLPPFRVELKPALAVLRQRSARFSTGIPGVDRLLGGGFSTGQIAQLFGRSSTGKTQLCMTAAARAAYEGNQVYIVDSDASYTPERLQQLVQHFIDQDAAHEVETQRLEEACSRIHCTIVCDPWEAINHLEALQDSLDHTRFSARVLIILDSIGHLFSPYMSANAQAHAMLANVSDTLRRTMQRHPVACVVTNYLVRGGGTGDGKPALGVMWERVPAINLRIARDDTASVLRTIQLLPNSPQTAELERARVQVALGASGVVDLS